METVRCLGLVPERLLTYLAALGLLRLVGTQADSTARGAWEDRAFILHTALSRVALEEFLLHHYRPAPLVMPWNKSGFEPKNANKPAGQIVARIEQSSDPRLELYRRTIAATRRILAAQPGGAANGDEKSGKEDGKEIKRGLVARCRNELPDEAVEWMDAAIVLTSTGQPVYPAVFGTGGNFGRMDGVTSYMQHLENILPAALPSAKRKGPVEETSRGWLRQALFLEGEEPLLLETVGQFDPLLAGGPNAGTGYAAESLNNPWLFVLALEGALTLAAAATRRLQHGSPGSVSLPFSVRTIAAGYPSAHTGEAQAKSRPELWLPLWERPWSYRELRHVFAEGRLSISIRERIRQAENSLDVLRAIQQLGVQRGITAFLRFGFLQRNGQSYFAICLGEASVEEHSPTDLSLLDDLDRPLALIREARSPEKNAREARSPEKNALSAAVFSAGHEVNEALFSFLQIPDNSLRRLHLFARLGRLEQQLSRSAAGALAGEQKDGKERTTFPAPLVLRSGAWLERLDTGEGPALRIAVALSSLTGAATPTAISGLRPYLEPITADSRGLVSWQLPQPLTTVWGGGSLAHNLCRVLWRRLLEHEQLRKSSTAGSDGEPSQRAHQQPGAPLSALCGLQLDDVVWFLEHPERDSLITEFIWACCAIRPRELRQLLRLKRSAPAGIPHFGREAAAPVAAALPPLSYSLLKLALTPPEQLPQLRRPEPGAASWWSGQAPLPSSLVSEALSENNSSKPVQPSPYDPQIVPLLHAQQARRAIELAARRLRLAGLPPLSEQPLPPREPAVLERLEAALLLPLTDGAVRQLVLATIQPALPRAEVEGA